MLKNIKFIVLDLDDTLLRRDKSISAFNRNVLELCREREILVFVATARPYRDVERVCSGLVLDGVICNNGASVYLKDEIISSSPIDKSQVKEIIKAFLMTYPEGHMIIESGNSLYSNKEILPIGWEYVPISCIDLDGFSGDQVYKCMVTEFQREDCISFEKIIPEDTYVVLGQHNHAMIMKKGINKAEGLKALISSLGLSPEEGIAFGDDYNDLDILNTVGVSVAMGNAIEPVKEAADYITTTNEEDGVGCFLHKMLLGVKDPVI